MKNEGKDLFKHCDVSCVFSSVPEALMQKLCCHNTAEVKLRKC